MNRLAVACAVALLATGCPDRGISEVTPAPAGVVSKDIPISEDLDLLFVIDNSSSTRDKQQLFASNYKSFVTALQGFPTGEPNLHIGVVTTSIDVGQVYNNEGGTVCHPAPGQNGLLQNKALDPTANCTQPTTDAYLSDVAAADGSGTRTLNFVGAPTDTSEHDKLTSALSCISMVGDTGCGFETQLEAMKRALDGSHVENAGFIRPGAFLAVVILTDEDDCSASTDLFKLADSEVGGDDLRCAQPAYKCDQPISPSQPGTYTHCAPRLDSFATDPADYAGFLTQLKGAGGYAVAVIAGPPNPDGSLVFGSLTFPPQPGQAVFTQPLAVEPSCMATIGGDMAFGRPALRLFDFASQLGDRGLFSTVCQSDYSSTLTDIGNLLFTAISPCLEGAIDLTDGDPNNPGVQPDCAVSDVITDDQNNQTETVIPVCHMLAVGMPDPASGTCWWLKQDPMCGTASNLSLQVQRSAAPAAGTKTRLSCAAGAPAATP